jgi:peptide/nickel transport system permease protein
MTKTALSKSTSNRQPKAAVETPFRRIATEYAKSKIAMGALFVIICLIILALLAPWISAQNLYDLGEINILDSQLPPGSKGIDGITYWLGTDAQGRDIVSAIFYGLRISLLVGVIGGLITMLVGTTIGLIGAYTGGKLDTLIMRLADLQMGFPAIVIAYVLLAIIGRGVSNVILAVVIAMWPYYARTARGAALVELNREYMEAAKCLALSRSRIIFHHLLPNCLPPLLVIGTMNVASAITMEASLSFLGIGVPITEPSLGLLIANGYQDILSNRYWMSVFPGVALLIGVASINLVGDQLRDVINPRLRA